MARASTIPVIDIRAGLCLSPPLSTLSIRGQQFVQPLASRFDRPQLAIRTTEQGKPDGSAAKTVFQRPSLLPSGAPAAPIKAAHGRGGQRLPLASPVYSGPWLYESPPYPPRREHVSSISPAQAVLTETRRPSLPGATPTRGQKLVRRSRIALYSTLSRDFEICTPWSGIWPMTAPALPPCDSRGTRRYG
jgi:hypothetical protein